MVTESLAVRLHGDSSAPALVYLPGVHGDWTLVASFRERIGAAVRFVEFTYPRSLVWSVEDHAVAVHAALAAHGVREGVLLGESFGSQVAWALLARCDGASGFQPRGLVLAGGFVRYPLPALVGVAGWVVSVLPGGAIRALLRVYAGVARWRHRHAPESAAGVAEFVARRTPEDLAAIRHRLRLIRGNDPGGVARRTTIPVYQLTGLWDPVVYYPLVRRWLRRHCPGYRETVVLGIGDHNVLGTAPVAAARHVKRWMMP